MPQCVASLESGCVELLAENVRAYVDCCSPNAKRRLHPFFDAPPYDNDSTAPTKCPVEPFPLPTRVSNELLRSLQRRALIDRETLALFTTDTCRLTQVGR